MQPCIANKKRLEVCFSLRVCVCVFLVARLWVIDCPWYCGVWGCGVWGCGV